MLINRKTQSNFAALFVQHYWQKKPCVIKHFIQNFEDPIDQNDLAGLAQEQEVDSRIVRKDKDSTNKDSTNKDSKNQHKWHVAQGPFDDFAEHCQGDWSLLVQGVDKYIDEVNDLTNAVNFIPYWRLDDVMVSFSSPNAGVGPHTDQYDVFIIQGEGSRRWQVGLPCEAKTIIPHPLLKQIDAFEAVIDQVLEPGDAVYIPPKHPHNGIALTQCMNYSIGFRAPTNVDLLNGMLDASDGFVKAQTRYSDENLEQLRTNTQAINEVSTKELQSLKNNMHKLLDTPCAEQALMKFLSIQQLPDCTDDFTEYTILELEAEIADDLIISKAPGLRPIYPENSPIEETFCFYIDGHIFEVDRRLTAATITLLQQQVCNISDLTKTALKDESFKECTAPLLKAQWLDLIADLLNRGYWEAIYD